MRISALFPYYEEDEVKKVKYSITASAIKVISHYSVAARKCKRKKE